MSDTFPNRKDKEPTLEDRLGALNRGREIPRSVWEKDSYREFELLRLAGE